MRTKPTLTFSKLDDEAGERLDRMFKAVDCIVEVNPGNVTLPARYKSIAQDILDMQVRENDVWVCSFPRTGSTWATEMVWLIGHDLDYEGAKFLLQIRFPFVDRSCFMAGPHSKTFEEYHKGTSVDVVKHCLPEPRYIRTHLPWHLLPVDMEETDGSAKPKVIYISRHPKDVVVSYYHYCRLVQRLSGTFEEFCDLFMKHRVPYCPVWDHILGFWNRRHDPNILFIKFEEMKTDLPTVVRRTAAFLNKTLSDDDVEKLCQHLSFENIKSNRAVNLETILEKSYGKSYLEQTDVRFIRKGEFGDWKNYMSEDLSRRFDEWAEQHLNGTGLSF